MWPPSQEPSNHSSTYRVKQDAETVRGRVAGAVLTQQHLVLDLLGYGQCHIRMTKLHHRDLTLERISGISFDDKEHITITLLDTGDVTARVDSVP